MLPDLKKVNIQICNLPKGYESIYTANGYKFIYTGPNFSQHGLDIWWNRKNFSRLSL